MEHSTQGQAVREERANAPTAAPTVGVVGLGTMGGGIAARLLGLGLAVHGWNRTRSKAEPLIAKGLLWHDTPREVAEVADVVISMVTDDAALRSVVDRADGILSGLRPDQLYIDMSSVGPSTSVAVAEQARGRGAAMVDAPVSGSVPQLRDGSLSVMVGGDDVSFGRAEPLLRLLGDEVTHVGRNGSGLLLKLAINISLAAQASAFSEGLLLAERGGIEAGLAARVMSASPIGSPMLKARADLFVHPADKAWFPIDLMAKDMRLALTEAFRIDAQLEVTHAAARQLTEAQRRGFGPADIAALHEVLATTGGNNA